MEGTAVNPPSRPRRLVVLLQDHTRFALIYSCSFLPKPGVRKELHWARSLHTLYIPHIHLGSNFVKPRHINDRLNLHKVRAVCYNHNWVYCWKQLDFTSWNISKGILQFFALSPGLNYLDRLPIWHPRQWVLLSFINTLCFPIVFSFLMCHASTLGSLLLKLPTNQKVKWNFSLLFQF